MKIEEKHKILKDWIMKKYNQPNHFYDTPWLYYSEMANYLRITPLRVIKWQELLKKRYSIIQLENYFIEIIRYELPILKGTKLYFSVNGDDNQTYKTI